jgi:hypothetical protein
MLNKKYTISFPVQVDFEGNDMSPQSTSIVININAKNTADATTKISNMLESLIRDGFGKKQ